MMQNRSSPSDSPWDRGFDISYRLACEQLAKVSDIKDQCRKSGARYIGPNEIVIDYLNQSYRILLPGISILLADGGTEASLRDKILILHYFTLAKGAPATGKLITYKQVPGGISYFPAFSQRAIAPLVRQFGRKPDLLKTAAAKFGGREAAYGDTAVTIDAFPHVPVTLVLWRGDAVSYTHLTLPTNREV